MTALQNTTDLKGKLLIAMPGMGDPRFERSVVYLCDHSAKGTMGLIVNKPRPELRLADLLNRLGLAPATGGPDSAVHFGGPVELGRGFVLHSPDYEVSGGTLRVDAGFAMTATLDVLQDMSRGRGPGAALLALGHAGWGPGQLEREISQNGWLTCDANPDLVFAGSDGSKWERALRSLGVDPLLLSAAAGRA